MVNKVILSGLLVRNPEMSYTMKGTAVTRFLLKVKRTEIVVAEEEENATEERDAVSFVPVIGWEDLAEAFNMYLRQDMEVSVVGELAIRSYRSRDNFRRITVEVVASEVHLPNCTFRSHAVEGEISLEDLLDEEQHGAIANMDFLM